MNTWRGIAQISRSRLPNRRERWRAHWLSRSAIWATEAERVKADWEAETEPGYRMAFAVGHEYDVAKLRAAWCEFMAALAPAP